MSDDALPVAARDVGALMSLGAVRGVGRHPPTVACLLRSRGGTESVWMDVAHPARDVRALWRAAHPGAAIPAGHEPVPLLGADAARRGGYGMVRLGVVPTASGHYDADGGYVLTGVSHSASGAHAPRPSSDPRFRYGS